MSQSSLKFGTSGLRGLAAELEGQAARRYVTAFLRHLTRSGRGGAGKVYLGRDFRASSPAVAADCAAAISQFGLEPVDCGAIPTPALAYHAMAAGCGAIMVTGSHIPADRNGLKFYSPAGEISKADEAGIIGALSDAVIDDSPGPLADEAGSAIERYFARVASL
ncbi:MAG: phosphomannomutase, partial [Candidatus Devosia euplotis]|nr:phosphomannomutase [Candidatus Devosia euplotis]